MNNISFGSAYKAHLTPAIVNNNPDAQKNLYNYLDNNQIKYKEHLIDYKFKDLKPDTPILGFTIVADDNKDIDIETFCANQGINLVKKESEQKVSVPTNIKLAPKGFSVSYIDTEKLEKFIKNQDSDISYLEETYNKYQKEETDFAIKSGDKYEVPKLFVVYKSDNGTTQSLKDYVSKFGADRLNPDSVGIYMQTDDSNINTYFGLKEMGIKNIPVYMDADSHQNAHILGLLAK